MPEENPTIPIKQLVENDSRFYPLTSANAVFFEDSSYLSSKPFATGVLTINLNGSQAGTFSANGANNQTINIQAASAANLLSLVASASYNSNTKKIEFFNTASTKLCDIDASAFIKDGMIDSVSIGNGTGANASKSCLLIDFNTDAESGGHTDIEIPLEGIFNPANYYTKTETDSTFVAQTDYDDDSEVVAAALNDLNGRIVTLEAAGSGDENVIETVKVNGTALTVTNKAVDVTVPTTLASLTDDSTHRLVTDTEKSTWNGKQNALSAGTFNVMQNGVTAGTYSISQSGNTSANIIVPTKVSDLTNDSGFTTNTGTVTGVKMNGTTNNPTSGVVDLGTVITSHQDISGKANLASPTFTGTPAAPTAAAGTNTTQIATTAFVQNAIPTVTSTYSSTGTDAVNGTAVASALSSYVTNTEFNNDARVVSAALNDLNDRLGDAEDASNKVTSLSSNSTDTEYPSAKAVYDAIQNNSSEWRLIASNTMTSTATSVSITSDNNSNSFSLTNVLVYIKLKNGSSTLLTAKIRYYNSSNTYYELPLVYADHSSSGNYYTHGLNQVRILNGIIMPVLALTSNSSSESGMIDWDSKYNYLSAPTTSANITRIDFIAVGSDNVFGADTEYYVWGY